MAHDVEKLLDKGVNFWLESQVKMNRRTQVKMNRRKNCEAASYRTQTAWSRG